MNHFEDTIVALATANGTGAIAIIRLSGKEAISIADSVFESAHKKKRLVHQKSHTLHLGFVKEDSKTLDQALFSIFKTPHSYTGEDIVEVSCHGSIFIQQQIIQLLIKKGARMANPGEFTLRAFLNGKMDLSQAEAVADLINADSEAAHQTALQQMRGGFSNELANLRKQLIHFASMLELELDFATEDVEFADREEFNRLLEHLEKNIKFLLDSFSLGNVIKEGIPVAIAGKPNAGKSSLLNILFNEEKAIVSDIAGTTRDTIEDTLTINGINFRFIDTAGLRQTEDQIEAIGVKRTKEKIQEAKILLYVFDQHDTTVNEIKTDLDSFARKDLKIILVQNKVDLLNSSTENTFKKKLEKTIFPTYTNSLISLSAHHAESVLSLRNLLANEVSQIPTNSQTIVTNSRHFASLNEALTDIQRVKEGLEMAIPSDLLAQDVRQALYHLGEITGEIDIDTDILGTIFSEFCIGK